MPPAKSWRRPWHTKSTKMSDNSDGLQASGQLSGTVAQSRPQGGTGYQNGPPKLNFRSSKGPFSSKIRVSGLRPEPCYLLRFRDI